MIMAEYIEREALIAKLDDIANDYLKDNSTQCDIAAGTVVDIRDSVIMQAPTADVVAVVRCKDCIFSHRDNDYRFGYACEKPLYSPQMGERRQRKLMQDIDFCSYGVRKETNNV